MAVAWLILLVTVSMLGSLVSITLTIAPLSVSEQLSYKVKTITLCKI